MIPWLLYLAFTFSQRHRGHGRWRVGRDSCEALALFVTSRLLLREDSSGVLAATATAVLLLTDAWLDVTSAAPGDELLTAMADGRLRRATGR